MSNESSKWSIYHPLKRYQLNSLSKEELSLVLATLTSSELRAMWFWCEGWGEWKAYSKFSAKEALPEPKTRRSNAPPLPKSAKLNLKEDTVSEITQVFNLTEHERAIVDRKYPRYDISIPIEVISNDQVYKTMTENVSLGGICTIDVLPEWVAGYCTAIMYPANGERVEVVCSVVEDQTLETKHRLEIVATVQLDYLRAWMENQGFEPERKI